MKNLTIVLSLAFFVSGCGTMMFFGGSAQRVITETAKPADSVAARKTMSQLPIPSGEKWVEAPFLETTPIPSFTQSEKQRGYLIFNRAVSNVVYPNTIPKLYERVESLSGFGCRGQFEPITFTLYPKRALKNLKVRVSSLKCGESVIPEADITVRLQTYWRIPYPHYVTAGIWKWRWDPELLEKVTVHSSPSGQCQRYWLTINVSKNARAGLYKGTLTVWDDGYDKAVNIPLTFRVMLFDLLKDPAKHYTAYYYDYFWGYDDSGKNKKNNAWLLKAGRNSYRAMKDFGFDAMPTVYLRYNPKTDEVYARKEKLIMETARKAGFVNIPFVPVCGGNAISGIIRKYDRKFKRPSHWRVTSDKMPSESIYPKITELFKKFNEKWKTKGYPKIYCCPLDEIAPSAVKFGEKVYAAVKKSGMGVYITKNAVSADAAAYENVVDAFCSQPYSMPYGKVESKGAARYWCYPNHNAWEVRIPEVMCDGGRMTYGFGNWRSGYSVLIPWAWSCWRVNKPITYFHTRKRGGKTAYYTPAGNPVNAAGEVVPTTYWTCFRAGYDDARYIYTLQKTIMERESVADPECRKLVSAGKKLLRRIWIGIKVEQKYKTPATVSILPEEFDALRWSMAELTERLSKYKSSGDVNTPSVAIVPPKKKHTPDPLKAARLKGDLIVKSLGDESFSIWQSCAGELKLSEDSGKRFTGSKSMKLDIKIDLKTDGGGEKGRYPVGWPRIRADFKDKELDLTKYEFLTFKVMIDSDRDEVADDYTPTYWTFASHVKNAKLPTVRLLGQVPQRVWIPVRIALNKLIAQNADLTPWKSIKMMQFGISEGKFADKTHLTFHIDDISLVSFKTPIIESVSAPSTFILPTRGINCRVGVLGAGFAKKSAYTVRLRLLDAENAVVADKTVALENAGSITLSPKRLTGGRYVLSAEIFDSKNKIVSTMKRRTVAVSGPASPLAPQPR